SRPPPPPRLRRLDVARTPQNETAGKPPSSPRATAVPASTPGPGETLARPMDEKSPGLILRIRPLTETSLIVHWLTPEAGRIATVAKGARRPKSPFRGKLDLFHLADFSFVRSRRSELHQLREVSLRDTHRALREDLHLLRQAAYCALLVEQATETGTPLPGIYQLMKDLL